MIEFNIYGDESRHTSDPTQPFMVIGAVKCPRELKRELVGQIHRMQARHNAHGELGWKRVSPNRADFYRELLDFFANQPELSFRCLVVDRNQLDHDRFNGGDVELGFYKLYYQMLLPWLAEGNRYHIYLDWQHNRTQSRFHDLSNVLASKLGNKAEVACLEPVTSSNLPLLGLADVLIGAVGYAWNDLHSSAFKQELCQRLAEVGGFQSLKVSTTKSAYKVNIFHFDGIARG